MVMLNNQMVSLKVSWEISMSLIQHQQADSPRRFSWWPIAWEKDQFSPVTSAVVMWSQKKGLGKPSDISMSLSFCRATKTHTHTHFRPVSLVGTASKSGLCESGELADEQIASSSMALWQVKRSVADVLMENRNRVFTQENSCNFSLKLELTVIHLGFLMQIQAARGMSQSPSSFAWFLNRGCLK